MRAGSLRHTVELSRLRESCSPYTNNVSPAGEVSRSWGYYGMVRAAIITGTETADGPTLKLRMRHHSGVAIGDRVKLAGETYSITAIEQTRPLRELEITLGEVTP